MSNVEKAGRSFAERVRENLNGGVLLIVMAVIAMIMANSNLSDVYTGLWEHRIHFRIGGFNLFSHHGEDLTLMQFINDALMAVFFFMVGLEIKREILAGELSSVRKALFPIIAAIGGMVVPVVLYIAMAHEGPAASGMAIPMATDIAFSLGVLSLLGKRVPVSLKIFLTAFAVVDDIGGILVIAIFYTGHISWGFIAASAAVLALLFIGNRMNIFRKSYYLLLGLVLWYLFLQSGIHCTIAGVLLALTIPSRPRISMSEYVHRLRHHGQNIAGEAGDVLSHSQLHHLDAVAAASENAVSPMQFLEHKMHGFVNYFIMPLFAFANAGVVIGGENAFGIVAVAVAVGLVLGKFIGVYLFAWAAIRLKWVEMPSGMTAKNLAGIAFLGGIGFTVSLFVANLSFAHAYPDLLNQAKMGVLLGTVVAGTVGFLYLNFVLPKDSAE